MNRLLIIVIVIVSLLAGSRQTFAQTTTLQNVYSGSVVIESPNMLGEKGLAIVITTNGSRLMGVVDGDGTFFQEQSAPLDGRVSADGSFSLTARPVRTMVAGRSVERSFTLDGTVSDDGETLTGQYEERIGGYTPDALVSTGQFLLSRIGRTTIVPLNAPAQVATGSLSPITFRLLDTDGNPISGETFSIRSEHGTVTPTSATSNADGDVTVNFQANGTPGQASITASCCDTIERSILIGVETPVVDSVALAVNGTTATATVTDQLGQPISGIVVNFFASLGNVSSVSGVSDEIGQVTVALSNGASADGTRLTAIAESLSDTVVIGSEVPTSLGLSEVAITERSTTLAAIAMAVLLLVAGGMVWRGKVFPR